MSDPHRLTIIPIPCPGLPPYMRACALSGFAATTLRSSNRAGGLTTVSVLPLRFNQPARTDCSERNLFMRADITRKYRPFPPIHLTDRQWPSQVIAHAPRWCSSDLRDGNQALVEPMDGERKRRYFDLLVRMGFKEIEVAFPSASQTDFDFVRGLIEGGQVPPDVAVQALTQSREDLIRRTFASLKGVKRAIPHLYNATAPIFREVVFGLDRPGLIELARFGARLFVECAAAQPELNGLSPVFAGNILFHRTRFRLGDL